MLEDELDILVDLCKALVNLHPVLIPLDFKSCGTTWKVYGSFVKDHQERLAERLSQGEAIEVLAGAIVANLQNLHRLARGGEDGGKEMEKTVTKTGALVKIVTSLVAAASPDKVVASECPHLLQLLLTLQQPPIAPAWLAELPRQRLASEVPLALFSYVRNNSCR